MWVYCHISHLCVSLYQTLKDTVTVRNVQPCATVCQRNAALSQLQHVARWDMWGCSFILIQVPKKVWSKESFMQKKTTDRIWESKHFIFLIHLSILCVWYVDSYLCHSLPFCGIVLTGMDAIVPAALHHIEYRLHRDVELGGPADLQLTWRLLQKHKLFPRLQRDS